MEALAVVEILGRRGEVVARERIKQWPAIVGRGFDADVHIDDPYVAAHHLRISGSESDFVVEDLGTLNGMQVIGTAAHTVTGARVTVAPGSTLRLGHTQIRLWRADSPVAAEVSSPPRNAVGWLTSLVWFILAIVLVGGQAWLAESGPGRDGDVTFVILVWIGVIAGWSGIWWLSDAHSRDGTSFMAHAGIASMIVVLALAGGHVLQTLAFATGFFDAAEWENGDLSDWLALTLGVYRHLRLVTRRQRWVQGLISGLCVAALVLSVRYVTNEESSKVYGKMSVPSLMRPGWMRLIEGQTTDSFVDELLQTANSRQTD